MGNNICSCTENYRSSINLESISPQTMKAIHQGACIDPKLPDNVEGSTDESNRDIHNKENKPIHPSTIQDRNKELHAQYLKLTQTNSGAHQSRNGDVDQFTTFGTINEEESNHKDINVIHTHQSRSSIDLDQQTFKIQKQSRVSKTKKSVISRRSLSSSRRSLHSQEFSEEEEEETKKITRADLTSNSIKRKLRKKGEILNIQDLIPDEKFLNADNNTVLFEGELLRYKPGIATTYIKRWVQVTRRSFKYYKSRYLSTCWLSKPLLAVPFSNINSVQRVNVIIPKSGQKSQRTKEKFQFEIFLKQNPNTLKHKKPNSSRLEIKLNDDSSISNIQPYIENSQFGDKLSQSPDSTTDLNNIQVNSPPKSKFQPKENGHLMKMPFKNTGCISYNCSPNLTPVEQRPNVINLNSQEEVKNFSIFLKQKASMLSKITNTEQITIKNPTANIVPSLATNTTWTHRENEWYCAETRLLFATDLKRDCEKWIFVLNWILELSNSLNLQKEM